MSALGLPGYHLHAAYAGDWQLSPTEVNLLILAYYQKINPENFVPKQPTILP